MVVRVFSRLKIDFLGSGVGSASTVVSIFGNAYPHCEQYLEVIKLLFSQLGQIIEVINWAKVSRG